MDFIIYPFNDNAAPITNYNLVLVSWLDVLSSKAAMTYIIIREIAVANKEVVKISDNDIAIDVNALLELQTNGFIELSIGANASIKIKQIVPRQSRVYELFNQLKQSGPDGAEKAKTNKLASVVSKIYKIYLGQVPDNRAIISGIYILKALIKKGYSFQDIHKTLEWIVDNHKPFVNISQLHMYITQIN